MSTPTSTLTRDVTLSAATLLSSAGTLVCCVLPAVLVALGAGAAFAGLVTAIPQLLYSIALLSFALGLTFTFVLPELV